MDCMGDQFLSGSRFSADQDRRVGSGHLVDCRQDLLQGQRGSDDFLVNRALNDFILKHPILKLQPFLQRVDLLISQCVGNRDRDHIGYVLQKLHFLGGKTAALERKKVNDTNQFPMLHQRQRNVAVDSVL